jgi:hypothetical protein
MATVRFFDAVSPPESGGPRRLHIGIGADTEGLERGQMRELVHPATAAEVEQFPVEYQAYLDAGGALTPMAAPANVDVPYVTGTGAVGQTLNCTMGNWTGEPTSYAYQWKRDGTADIGSGADTYLVAAADAGHSIACVVTAANAQGATAAPPSNAVLVAGTAAATAGATGRTGAHGAPHGTTGGTSATAATGSTAGATGTTGTTGAR